MSISISGYLRMSFAAAAIAHLEDDDVNNDDDNNNKAIHFSIIIYTLVSFPFEDSTDCLVN